MSFVDVMTSDVVPLLYYRRILFDMQVDFSWFLLISHRHAFFFCLIAQIPYRFFSRIFTSYPHGQMNRIVLCGFRHEKTAGRSPLTQSLQRGILRVSEIFGYDENKYPGGMLQRAAGGCKAVHEPRGKILSELSG